VAAWRLVLHAAAASGNRGETCADRHHQHPARRHTPEQYCGRISRLLRCLTAVLCTHESRAEDRAMTRTGFPARNDLLDLMHCCHSLVYRRLPQRRITRPFISQACQSDNLVFLMSVLYNQSTQEAALIIDREYIFCEGCYDGAICCGSHEENAMSYSAGNILCDDSMLYSR
jgi:hypothetical protein